MRKAPVIAATIILSIAMVGARPAFADPVSALFGMARSIIGFRPHHYHHHGRGTFTRHYPADTGAPVLHGEALHGETWLGSTFWPDPLDDFVGAIVWPGTNGTFWRYGYGEIADAVFVSDRAVNEANSEKQKAASVQVCASRDTNAADLIERIKQTVQLSGQQAALLGNVKTAFTEAINRLNSSCQNENPVTPVSRLAAIEHRLRALRQAGSMLVPSIEKFYGALSDQQKAKFDTAPAFARHGRVVQICQGRPPQWPAQAIEQSLKPQDQQPALLEQLKGTMQYASYVVNNSCPEQQALALPERIQAATSRLSSLWYATKLVQSATNNLYAALSEDQRYRFDTLNASRVAGQ